MRDATRLVTLLVLAMSALALPSAVQAQGDDAERGTVTVEMKDFAFKPAKVTVRPGDTVRFVQTTATPHNVEFREVPEDARLGEEYVVPVEEIDSGGAPDPPARVGPYLLEKGETYEIVITDAFTAGRYGFVCTPHEAMGMKGSLTVERPGGPMAVDDR